MKSKIEKYGAVHISHKYRYESLEFDSGWELALYIWLRDHGV